MEVRFGNITDRLTPPSPGELLIPWNHHVSQELVKILSANDLGFKILKTNELQSVDANSLPLESAT